MTLMSNFLYKKQYKINDSIKIVIPSVGEIFDNEDDYYSVITVLTAMPIDFMVLLDDIGIDYTEINEYDLFLKMFWSLKKQDTHLIFGDLQLDNFEIYTDYTSKENVLYDAKNDIVINKAIHAQIAEVLRKIHHLKKNQRKPANKEAKEYMLKRARIKAKRNQTRKQESQLEPLIVAMVNTEQYKYNFDETRNLSIYQFNESVRQIVKKVDYDNRMYGIYTGTISADKLSQEDLNWLTHK